MGDWSNLGGAALLWEPTGRRTYDLRSDGGILARLTWQSECGSLALGESAEGRWTFKRMGFFHPFVTVRAQGAPGDLAVMRSTRGATLLQFADGRSFAWGRLRPRGRETGFFDAPGRPVVVFGPPRSGGGLRGSMTVDTPGTPAGTVALLTLLGWYRLVLERMDEDAALIAATCASLSATM
jgi:hypothetical protein